MKKFQIFVILIFFIFFPLLALAQTVLKPGSTNFTIQPIIIEPPEVNETEGDYGGNPNYPSTLLTPQTPLGLQGDVNYLTIKWDARWADNSQRDMGVRCYLNCPNPGDNIDVNCASYQKCEYLGPPGKHSCTILNPRYLFKVLNNATCKFYDPSLTVEFLPYPQRSFWIIDYENLVPSTLSLTLGEDYNFRINIKNLGLIPTSFFVNFTDIQNPLNIVPVIIEGGQTTTEKVSYGKIAIAMPRVTFLATGTLRFQTDVKSNLEPTATYITACNLATDCPPTIVRDADDLCFANRCWQRSITQVTVGIKSLSEFGFIEAILIILFATILFFLSSKNIKIKK
ncbi:MAG: hypothetical protein QXO57_03445 [Candidatus Aenigmatarchaeota archaeon]